MLGELGRNCGKRLEVVECRPAALEVPRPEACRDQLLEKGGLAAGGRPERPEVPRVESVTR